ncbi:hypothetical protein OCA8868_00048 [Octadecabacter ascidiaceicola]|uniref:Uncharacterized protein n=1 Tax=Octadecabacter ascidiaceicola TaxID=1655543 RepID=A0A238JJI0_9RHOB|nr:hypothetical protein OCA8868_00048 [Octadecabacter ascidiaceicola]
MTAPDHMLKTLKIYLHETGHPHMWCGETGVVRTII